MKRRSAAIALALVVLLVALAKLPFLGKGVFGDAQAYMVPNPLLLIEHGGSPFIPKEVHPPLYFYAEAAAFLMWPRSPHVFHVLAWLVGLGSLVAAYSLGRRVFGRREGVTAAVLLAACPLFLTQIGVIRLSVPLLFLTLMTVSAAWRRSWVAYAVWGSALMLTKFSGLPVVLAGLALAVRRGERRRHLLLSAIPLVVLAGWLVACRVHYGWFLHPENTADIGLTPAGALSGFRWWLGTILANQGQAAVAAVGLISLVHAWYSGRRLSLPRGSLAVTLLPLALGIVAFSAYHYTFPRYLLPYLALWFVLCARFLWTGGRTVAVVGTLLVVVAGIAGYLRKDTFGDMRHHESDLSYLPLLDARESAARYLEQHWDHAAVLAPPKLCDDLRVPAYGYVVGALPGATSDIAGDLPDVYYRFPVLNRRWPKRAEKRLREGQMVLLREFGDPFLGVAVFRVAPKGGEQAASGQNPKGRE
jgi:hypothetical protein